MDASSDFFVTVLYVFGSVLVAVTCSAVSAIILSHWSELQRYYRQRVVTRFIAIWRERVARGDAYEPEDPFAPTRYYFIAHTSEDGSDLDALIEATSDDEAVRMWHEWLDGHGIRPCEPENVFVIPAKSGTSRMAKWHGSIIDCDVQCIHR